VSAALLVALAPWLAGCATEIHLLQSPGVAGASGSGRLLVRVFEDRSDRRRNVATLKDVVTELYRVQGGSEKLLRDQREPRWSVADLPPGEYLLRATRCVDEFGVVQTSFHEVELKFAVRAGQTTVADVVLKDPKQAWVGVLVAIVLAYATVEKVKADFNLVGIIGD
jgi:hypothetical protein